MLKIRKVLKINPKGSLAVTIPKELAEWAGITGEDSVIWQKMGDGGLRMQKVKA